MVDFTVVPERAALINVDMQNLFVQGDWPAALDGLAVLDRINRLAAVCRQAGILVIHATHILRPDGSNMGVLGEVVPPVRDGIINKGSESAALHKDLIVEPDDVLLEKPRFGAFHGTDLELILRSRGVDTIIISGISTPVCCDTTAREANARDFCVPFLSDATATRGAAPEEATKYQQATLEISDGLFGQVLTTDELLQKIANPTPPEVTVTSN